MSRSFPMASLSTPRRQAPRSDAMPKQPQRARSEGDQVRAARALLGLSQAELARQVVRLHPSRAVLSVGAQINKAELRGPCPEWLLRAVRDLMHVLPHEPTEEAPAPSSSVPDGPGLPATATDVASQQGGTAALAGSRPADPGDTVTSSADSGGNPPAAAHAALASAPLSAASASIASGQVEGVALGRCAVPGADCMTCACPLPEEVTEEVELPRPRLTLIPDVRVDLDTAFVLRDRIAVLERDNAALLETVEVQRRELHQLSEQATDLAGELVDVDEVLDALGVPSHRSRAFRLGWLSARQGGAR
jgi:hypothetical protein